MVSPSTDTLVRPGVRTHWLDGDLLLFDESRKSLVALNSTAAFVWLGLTDGASAKQLAAELSDESGVPIAQAEHDIEQLLREWRRVGLLGAAGDEVTLPPAARLVRAGDLPEIPAAQRARAVERVLQLVDAEIRVRGDPDAASIIDQLFGHTVVARPNGGDERPVLEIFRSDGRWFVLLEGTLLGQCARSEELPALVYGTMVLLVYKAAKCFAAVHAAAVAKGGQCVLMPGESGSGKSTLTATLVARGYDYCTDDLAILTRDPVMLRPVPLLMVVKDGAWPLLAGDWPGLEALPAHRRSDGKVLKYLSPDGRRSAADRLTIAALVFPRFVPGRKAELRPISRSDALVRTTWAGYDLAAGLDEAAVRVLVDRFQTLPCYELHFDDLHEAVGLISGLLPE